MSDRSESLDDDTEELSKTEAPVDTNSEEYRQKMFDETFSKLMDKFGEACEEMGVETAVAIAKVPNIDQPIVFYRAQHIVEAGALIASLLREIKSDVQSSLDTDSQN